MRKGIVGFAIICSLIGTSQAFAVQSKETINCGKAIATGTVKFQKVITTKIAQCLLAVQDCAGDQACLGKLIEITPEGKSKGKCAKGKLDEGYSYFGPDSAADPYYLFTVNDIKAKSKIGKAYLKFILLVDRKCFQTTADLGTGPDGLGIFPFPISLVDFFNIKNSDEDTNGFACAAHKAVDPLVGNNKNALAAELVDFATANGLASKLSNGYQWFTAPNNCR